MACLFVKTDNFRPQLDVKYKWKDEIWIQIEIGILVGIGIQNGELFRVWIKVGVETRVRIRIRIQIVIRNSKLEILNSQN